MKQSKCNMKMLSSLHCIALRCIDVVNLEELLEYATTFVVQVWRLPIKIMYREICIMKLSGKNQIKSNVIVVDWIISLFFAIFSLDWLANVIKAWKLIVVNVKNKIRWHLWILFSIEIKINLTHTSCCAEG